jgi:hypothetical protein
MSTISPFSCEGCAFWLYNHPNRMGVCTYGPDDPEGSVAPVSADTVGITLAIEWAGSTASTADTICNNWEYPGFDEDMEEGE